jgi:PhzF family phenazine biosynthesis protein
MKIPIYQIDAFSAELFKGNPAAVCPLDNWLSDALMQAIALENNLSETAFFVPKGDDFHIRWFTPKSEVDLCGHATLATAFVIYHVLGYEKETLRFDSRSGILTVTQDNDWLTMDFPAQPPAPCDVPEEIINAFSVAPIECLTSEDLILVFERETDVETADPDLAQLIKLDSRGVAITARSTDYDFIARFFAPKHGIPEDPETGSAYTQLAPYWAAKIGPKRFHVKQVSPRGGELTCEVVGDRVFIAGKATKYMEGTIRIEA